MLVTRIITATVLAILIALAVFELPLEYFSLLIALITLMAAWEWTNLVSISTLYKRVLFLVVLILPMLGLNFWTQILELIATLTNWPDVRDYSGILEWFVIAPVIFWITSMILIRNAPINLLNLQLKMRYKALIGGFILLSAWMFLTRLRAFYGPEMTMYFLLLIWGADVAAYFTGRKWGTTKLAPEISPGKTVAGVRGALVLGFILAVAFIGYYSFRDGFVWTRILDFVLLSLVTVLISIYGDLFISLAKRQGGVKDSGNMLPGHGDNC